MNIRKRKTTELATKFINFMQKEASDCRIAEVIIAFHLAILSLNSLYRFVEVEKHEQQK